MVLTYSENSEFKRVKLHLKIDHVSYRARAEGLVHMDLVPHNSVQCIYEEWDIPNNVHSKGL